MKTERVAVGHELDRLFGLGTVGSMTDSQLIAVFLEGDDQRGGAGIRGHCRASWPDGSANLPDCPTRFPCGRRCVSSDISGSGAKVQTLGSRELLGHWLRGVAVRTAKKAKALAAKQRSREYECALAQVDAFEGSRGEDQDEDIYRILHEEIDRLPRSYRTAISACYLEGKSQSQAAVQLRLSESTIRGRLARHRKLLDRRLKLRQVSPTYALFTVGAVIARGGAMPRDMVRATARTALDSLNQSQTGSCRRFVADTSPGQWRIIHHVALSTEGGRGRDSCAGNPGDCGRAGCTADSKGTAAANRGLEPEPQRDPTGGIGTGCPS